ncbi:MAG: PIG-L family deacetylase [Chloroflexi bacterium]|nr:PIG-L family deacetylase [Chloroflexota bacterium]
MPKRKQPWPFEDVKRLIFVAAHPDDLETIAGGSIHMMAQRGVEVIEVLCTDGNIGTHDTKRYTRASLARTRRKEARAAAAYLGIKDVVFLGHDDGELEPSLELRAQIAKQYRIFQPDTLMTFDPQVGGHPDHRAAGRAAMDALIPASMPLYRPEQLRRGVRPSQVKRQFLFGGRAGAPEELHVDVSHLWDVRMNAMRLHECQFGHPEFNFDWLENWMQAQGKPIGVKYAEKFYRA